MLWSAMNITATKEKTAKKQIAGIGLKIKNPKIVHLLRQILLKISRLKMLVKYLMWQEWEYAR